MSVCNLYINRKSAAALTTESAISMEDENVLLFREAVLTGQWQIAESLLSSINSNESNLKVHFNQPLSAFIE